MSCVRATILALLAGVALALPAAATFLGVRAAPQPRS